MGLIEVVQKRQYYYIHLLFIYTKKKLGEILGNCNIFPTPSTKKEEPKTTEIKKETKPKEKPSASTVPNVLKKWLEHCNKTGINYQKSNLTYWKKKLKNRITIDQQEAVYQAIDRGWRDFYLTPKEKSKYRKFLGQSLMMEKDCDTLLDIWLENRRYVYQFKNIKVTSTATPYELFKRYGYKREDTKKSPISSAIQQKLMGLVQRF